MVKTGCSVVVKIGRLRCAVGVKTDDGWSVVVKIGRLRCAVDVKTDGSSLVVNIG